MKVLAVGLTKFGDKKATVKECSDGRHLVRVETLDGSVKAYSEWLCGNDYLEWLRCLRENAVNKGN